MVRPAVLTVLVLVIVAALVIIAGYATNLWPGMGGSVPPAPVPTAPPVPATSPITQVPTSLTLPVFTPVPAAGQSCTTDDDCVPAECCHPTSCINKAYKHVCTLMCTDVCQGPIDCGAGHCGCINGTCGVRSSQASSSPFATVAQTV